jgi:hypothetical protein
MAEGINERKAKVEVRKLAGSHPTRLAPSQIDALNCQAVTLFPPKVYPTAAAERLLLGLADLLGVWIVSGHGRKILTQKQKSPAIH